MAGNLHPAGERPDLLARERVERDGMAGLVIGNEDPRTFSVGADLQGMRGNLARNPHAVASA